MYDQDLNALCAAEEREAMRKAMKSAVAKPFATITTKGAFLPRPVARAHGDVLLSLVGSKAQVVPFKKNDTPKPQPPHRPAPAQPLRPAAQKVAQPDFNKRSITDAEIAVLRRIANGLPVSDDLLKSAGLR